MEKGNQDHFFFHIKKIGSEIDKTTLPDYGRRLILKLIDDFGREFKINILMEKETEAKYYINHRKNVDIASINRYIALIEDIIETYYYPSSEDFTDKLTEVKSYIERLKLLMEAWEDDNI